MIKIHVIFIWGIFTSDPFLICTALPVVVFAIHVYITNIFATKFVHIFYILLLHNTVYMWEFVVIAFFKKLGWMLIWINIFFFWCVYWTKYITQFYSSYFDIVNFMWWVITYIILAWNIVRDIPKTIVLSFCVDVIMLLCCVVMSFLNLS